MCASFRLFEIPRQGHWCFDPLTALLRKLGVPGSDIAIALQVLMAEPRHKIPNVLLTQAMLRDLGL
jgi:hypothetical protein